MTSPATPRHISLPASFSYCYRVTRAAHSSFPIAFRLLPAAKRRSMDALYAFLRISDDLADEPGEPSAKRCRLQAWRDGLLAAIDGKSTHPIHPALIATIRQHDIPLMLLTDALDGVESDLEPIHFTTFAHLYPYCYRVASVVGLACIRIWGLRPGASIAEVREAEAAAEAAGIAFQLTNILRDLREDLDRGRVYLPADELARFDVSLRKSLNADDGFLELMRFQIARAKHYYRRAERLDRLLSADGRAIFRVMSGTYRALLAEIERDPGRVLCQRVRLTRWRKGLVFMEGWAVKRGWL